MTKIACFAVCCFLMIGGLPVSAAASDAEPVIIDAGEVISDENTAPAAAAASVAIDASTFPDSYFRTYVKNHFDTDGDGALTDAEMNSATSIAVSNTGVSTLQGIEYFPELSYLECQYDKLTSLDISRNPKLLDLRCDGNSLTSLDAGGNPNLQYLWCSENRLTSLDISGGGLLMLSCEKNQLKTLDISANSSLTMLHCGDNQLEALDISANRELDELYCQNNQIASLDVSAHPALVYLNCDNNRLSSIDVSQNPKLSALECCGNGLTSLDVRQNSLMTYLKCASNKLSSLDVSANSDLIGLDCSDNAITGLDLSCTRDENNPSRNHGPELSDLYCGKNPLGSLDVSQQTKLMYLDCPDAGLGGLSLGGLYDLLSLNCSSNDLGTLDLSRNPELKYLDCSDDGLSRLDLDVLRGLEYLDCSGNGLTGLDLTELKDLATLHCSSNSFGSLDLSNNTKIKDFVCKQNVVRAPMTKSGKKWKFDLTEPLKSANVKMITISTKNAKRLESKVTVTSSKMPAKLVYSYKTGGPGDSAKIKVTVQPTASKKICSHTGSYVTIREATVFQKGKKERTCPICGTVQTKTVKKLTPTIKLNASSFSLKVGQSTRGLKVSKLAKGDSVKSWKSSNKKVVKVTQDGEITATNKTGKAKVTVTLASGKKKSVTVKVQKTAVKTTSISGVPKSLSLGVGDSKALSPTLKPFTSLQKISYKSSAKNVASVDADGTVTAIARGSATITVTSGKKKVTCKVKVK